MWGGRMTSSATARARARRQLQHSGEVVVPQIRPRQEPESGSHLHVVPQPARRRGNVSRATLVVFTLTVFTIAVVVFQATIAEQQLRLDALTQDLRLAESHYDNLRQERAELLSPSRLREEAVMMGMYQGLSTKFVEVQSQVVAEVMSSTAKMSPLFAEPPAGVASAGALAQMHPVEVANRP